MTSLHTFCSLSLVVTMSRHRFSCRDITVRLCRLYWLLFTSRHQVSCRDNSSWYCAFEQVSPAVVTSAYGLKAFNWIPPDVTTSASSLCQFHRVVLGVATSVFLSRHQFSCHDFTFCCGRLHWMFMMSRLQLLCRDITSLISAPSSAVYVVIPVATCIKFSLIFLMS